VTGALQRLTHIGVLPEHDRVERLRRSSLTLFALIVVALAPLWVITYWLLERPLPAAIPLGYQVVTVLGLVHLWRTKRFGLFQATQVATILALPVLLQWSLGGFVNASAVIIWSFSAPIGALFLFGPRAAMGWFVAFALAVVVSAVIDPLLAATAEPLPPHVVRSFFVLNVLAPLGTAFVLLLYLVSERDRAIDALEAERATSDRLLLNVLPAPIAERLKAGEELIADRHEEVTVLFADVVGFTPFAERTAPERVVELLNRVFTAFDQLVEQHGLEKIKTVGDAYMAAGGLPAPRADHVEAVAEVALKMQAEAERCVGADWPGLEIRIGIASGPVIAGVIGRRKFIYDLWGDTVNTAGRMELHGIPCRIQVTEAVEQRLRGRYRFEPRGEVEIKGKGAMTTYLLLGHR
jgi:adenylate cyclase